MKTVKLGDVCEILDSRRKPVTKKDRSVGPYPYYGATGILDYVADYIFDEPLVLIGEDGAKWGAFENTAFKISGKTWVNNHAHVVRPDRELLLDKWLIYCINGTNQSEYITGVTVPKLNQAMLRKIEIPLPPIDEQKKIVQRLDAAFEKIDRAIELTKMNTHNAIKLRAQLIEAEMRTTDSVDALLGDFCSFENGDRGKNYPSKSQQTNSGIPFINAGNLDRSTVNFNKMAYISSDTFDQLGSGKVRGNDILFCLRGSIGKFAATGNLDKGAIASSLVIIRPDLQKATVEYLLYYFEGTESKRMIAKYENGAAQPNLSAGSLKKFEISLPSIDSQKHVVTKLDQLTKAIDVAKEQYEKKIIYLSELKQSLLTQAFSQDKVQ